MDLHNKVILITGSSSHIGQSTAIEFARHGAKLIINSRNNTQGGQQTVKQITDSGGQALYIQADISNPKSAQNLIDKTIKHYGTIDILINNAGYTEAQPFLESTPDHWISQFNDNFFGAVWCSQAAAKIMLQNKTGKILNTTSIRGFPENGRKSIMAYSAAKAALINFTKTLAKELAPHIQVNAIAPGFVWTSNYESMDETSRHNFINSTQLKRWITPKEIAQGYLYLSQADSITGQILTIDAGFTLKDA